MAIRANISSGYRRKLALIGIFLAGFGLWAGYDAFIKYPPEYEKYNAFLSLKNEGRQADWPTIAQEKGWPEEEPKARNDGHFYFNYAILGVMLPVGLFFIYSAATAGKRWIMLDDQNILSTHAGKQTPLNRIVDLNEKRWKEKGIAIVTYQDDQGQQHRIVLDDFNYELQPTRDIFKRVKETLHPESASPADEAATPSA